MHRRNFIRHAAGCAVFALGAPPLLALGHSVVTGRVVSSASQNGLAGVLVSNGDDVTWTDVGGRFTLPCDPSRHPFIILEPPANHVARQGWYHATADGREDYTFSVQPTPAATAHRIRILHITDSHIGVNEKPHYVSPSELAADLSAAIAAEQPDVVIVTGDLTDLGRPEDLRAYADAVNAAAIPVFSLFAGHDGLAEYRARRAPETRISRAFESALGPVQQSFRLGGHYFVFFPEPYGFPPSQRRQLDRWFSRLLDAASADERIVLVTHDPTTWHPDKKPEVYGPSLRDFPAGKKPRLILNGQYHGARVFRHDGVTIVGAPSVSMGGIDGSPRSYAIIESGSDDVRAVVRPFRRACTAAAAGVVVWRTALGHSVHRTNPVVAGDRVLVSVGDFGDSAPGVTALDAATGTIRWRLVCDEVVKHSPVIDDAAQRGYVITVAGTAYCFDLSTGAVVWRARLPNHPDRWLYQRPLLIDGRVIVPQASARLALNAVDGEIVWSQPHQWENAWHLFALDCPVQAGRFFSLTPNSFRGYGVECVEAATGKVQWRHELATLPGGFDRVYQLLYASPVLANDRVIVPGLADSVVLLHASDGRVVWTGSAARSRGPAAARRVSDYATIAEFASGFAVAENRLLVTTSHGLTAALDFADGNELWRTACPGESALDCVPYFRDVGNQLAPPAIISGQMIFGGTDGRLRTLTVKDGALVSARALGSPITGKIAPLGQDLCVATFDGTIWRLPVA